MWRRQAGRASILRLSFSRWELLGKEFGLAGIKCSIFFSRPPKVTLAFQFLEASSPFEEYNLCPCMQEKNGAQQNFFRTSQRNFGTRRFVPDAAVWLAGDLYFATRLPSPPSPCDKHSQAVSFPYL